MSAPAIELRGVAKRYGSKIALAGIDLAVDPGTVQEEEQRRQAVKDGGRCRRGFWDGL